MKITTVQSKVFVKKEDTLEHIRQLFYREEFQDTDLVTLPEMFMCPYENEKFLLFAEPENGETWQFCSDLAKKYGIILSAGTIPEEEARLMTDRGAVIILCPASFNMTTGPLHWELMFRQRAVDNQVFTVGTSPALDLSASYHSWGQSILRLCADYRRGGFTKSVPIEKGSVM